MRRPCRTGGRSASPRSWRGAARAGAAKERAWVACPPRGPPGPRARARQGPGLAPVAYSKAPQLVADEVQWRYQNDGDRLRQHLVDPEPDHGAQQDQVDAVGEERHDQEAQALPADMAALRVERPEPVP